VQMRLVHLWIQHQRRTAMAESMMWFD